MISTKISKSILGTICDDNLHNYTAFLKWNAIHSLLPVVRAMRNRLKSQIFTQGFTDNLSDFINPRYIFK